jgi:hypothetical protein
MKNNVAAMEAKAQDAPADRARIVVWKTRTFRPGADYVAVWIDVRKLDGLLPLASNMAHVSCAGKNGILGKYAGFDEFVRSHKRIEMPYVTIERACTKHPGQDIAYIFDGRHRFAWMRDHGAGAMPVAALRSEANEVAGLVGTSARVCRVTMRCIPEWKPPLWV